MTLRFLAIDPDTNGENCPALFLEEETGDLLFQGAAITDPVVLAESGTHSPLGETESLVRLPARMRAIIMEALNGQGAAASSMSPRRSIVRVPWILEAPRHHGLNCIAVGMDVAPCTKEGARWRIHDNAAARHQPRSRDR